MFVVYIFKRFSKDAEGYNNTKVQTEPNFVIATVHRQENTDDEKRLRSIFSYPLNIFGRVEFKLTAVP